MNTPDWSKWLCRCSSISKILTNGKGSEPVTEKQWETIRETEKKIENGTATEKQKLEYARLIQKDKDTQKPVLGDTCISYLLESYAWEMYGKFNVTKELDIEYIRKGREVEKDSIDLLSFVEDRLFVKNEERFDTEYITGHPDVLIFEPQGGLEGITDIKSAWSLPSFLYKKHKGLDDGYREQVAGYGWLLDNENLSVSYTLVNTPESIRNDYKFRLAKKMDVVTTESPEFLREWAKIERSMIFDDIPPVMRLHKISIQPFSEQEKIKIQDRVKECRAWLADFHVKFCSLSG